MNSATEPDTAVMEPSVEELPEQPDEDDEDIIDLVTVYTGKEARIEGVVAGRIEGFTRLGRPRVNFSANRSGHPVTARTTAPLSRLHSGGDVALMFEETDPNKPIIIGLMHNPVQAGKIGDDEKTAVIASDREVLIRCGEASIHLRRDGKIIIKGKDILSRARRNHDIKGGMINLN
jgi:hypothetical protein